MSASLLFLRQRTAKETQREHASLDVIEHEGDLRLHPHRNRGGASGMVHVQKNRPSLNAVWQILEVERVPREEAFYKRRADGD